MCSVIKFYIASLLFHTESYNNFLPGAIIHLGKQTQISPLGVDY